jgi:uncharacterized protein (AIM24 family)
MAGYSEINSKLVEVAISPGEQVLARRGAMLAYTGEVRFKPTVTAGSGIGGFVGRVVRGENIPMMICEGRGRVLYGALGLHVTHVALDNDQLTVEADKLLCYDGTLQAGTKFLGEKGGFKAVVAGQMTGQGLFTTQLAGSGNAVKLSHGPVFVLDVGGQSKVAVDPQAYVGHTGAIDIKLDASVGWREAVGRGSGEAFQLKLSGNGQVFVQASEERL